LVANLTIVNFSRLSGRENIPVCFHPLHRKNPVLPICQTNMPYSWQAETTNIGSGMVGKIFGGNATSGMYCA
jgi:hypothetical protein